VDVVRRQALYPGGASCRDRWRLEREHYRPTSTSHPGRLPGLHAGGVDDECRRWTTLRGGHNLHGRKL